MNKNNSIDFYVVNFFACPITNYTKLINLQAKENSSSIYYPKKNN